MKQVIGLLLLVLVALCPQSVRSVCSSPLLADGSSTIAPPILDSQSTFFSANPSSVSINDARLVTIGVQWTTVLNRKLVYIGLGDSATQCALANPARIQFDNTSNSCLTFIKVTYVWPLTLYGVCAPLFTKELSDESAERLAVGLHVQYEETYNVSRAGMNFSFKKVVESTLPLVFSFPKKIEVATAAVRVFSAGSIDVQGGLLEQIISTNSPFQTQFFTLNGRAFVLSNPIPSYSGTQLPLAINVTYLTTKFLETSTRQTIWSMTVIPDKGSCQLDGVYSIKFTLSWSGTDSNGLPLSPSQNPLPQNQTVIIQFNLVSQDYCGGVVSQSITPTLRIYRYPVDPNNITLLQLKESPSFFSNDTMYFQGIVTSTNLPLTSTTLNTLWITFTDNTPPLYLVVDGVPRYPSVNFTLSKIQPRDQTLFQLVLATDVFPIPVDSDSEFSFNVVLVVAYQNSKRKRDQLMQLTKRQGGGAIALQTRKVVKILGFPSVSSAHSLQGISLFLVLASILLMLA